MRHANPADLVDLAEGVDRPEIRAHLDDCELCRNELSSLEVMLGGNNHTGRDGDRDELWNAAGFVPEPSPLFWTHFPRRVGHALEQAMQREPGWWAHARSSWTWPWVGSAVAAALVLGVALGAGLSSSSRDRSTEFGLAADLGNADAFQGSREVGTPGDTAESDAESSADDGWAMLLLMADTAAWEETPGDELFLSHGAAERAVFDLSLAEREELQRLLESEIGDRAVGTS